MSDFDPSIFHQNKDTSQINISQDLIYSKPPKIHEENKRSPEVDESLTTVKNLRIIKTEDVDKIIEMDKEEIIKYYEGIIDKCHSVIFQKRDKIR